MMKRYMAFACDDYYPEGGARDYIGSADDEMDARLLVVGFERDGGHVFDTETESIVWTWRKD
jgi:hypothetical protein